MNDTGASSSSFGGISQSQGFKCYLYTEKPKLISPDQICFLMAEPTPASLTCPIGSLIDFSNRAHKNWTPIPEAILPATNYISVDDNFIGARQNPEVTPGLILLTFPHSPCYYRQNISIIQSPLAISTRPCPPPPLNLSHHHLSPGVVATSLLVSLCPPLSICSLFSTQLQNYPFKIRSF